MKISLEWLSDFVELPKDKSAAELAHELTLKTVEVEDIIDLSEPLRNVVVAQVEEVKTVGDWRWTRCAVGGDRSITVMSRVQDLAEGMMVAVALPGARLATTDLSEESVRVTAVEIEGYSSEGVICSAAKLRLQRLFPSSKEHSVLDLSDLEATVGAKLAEVLGFNDIVFEIDNKSLTNRPDLWGHYGIAREFATIYGLPLRPLPTVVRPPSVTELIGNVDATICQRIAAVTFAADDDGSAAPLWMRSRLARIGEASLGLYVDISNYVMFTVGQPTHVYDADRVTLPLSVSGNGGATTLELLTGVSVALNSSTPVIADASGPIAIAGIMGSAASAVRERGRNFVLEAATFRPRGIRRTSHRIGLRTEASMRFEKGLDTQRVDAAVDLFLYLLGEVAPCGYSLGSMQDVDIEATSRSTISVELGFLARRIGAPLDAKEVRRVLESLGFDVDVEGSDIRVIAPTWRSTGDVALPHDIVEEIARIHGYDNLPSAPISITLRSARALNRHPVDRTVRELLATRAGMQEVLTYPWASDAMLAAAGLSKDATVRFDGAPAPDRDSLRPSLVPNLLESAVTNLRYTDQLEIFEVGVVFSAEPLAAYQSVFEPMPTQTTMLAAVLTGPDAQVLFRQAKGALEILRDYGHFKDLAFENVATTPWADRSAKVAITANGAIIGTLGLLTKRAMRMAGLTTNYVACFELDLGAISVQTSRENRFEKLSDLPEADFDLSVVVADEVPWSAVDIVARGAHPLVHRAEFVDEFRGTWVPDGHRSLTLRITLRPEGATLTSEAIGAARVQVLDALVKQTGAQLRS